LRNQIFVQYLPDKTEIDSMRYLLTLSLVLLFALSTAFSTTITGTVTDATDGKPLVSAAVFIAGTTFGTNTKPDGSFTLNFIPSGSSQVVIAYLGYQTFTKNANEIAVGQPLKVEMQFKSQQISAVSVIGYDTNRKKNMAEFLFCFLGDSEFGKKCTILNPNVLHLQRRAIPHKLLEYELLVTADSALIIENKLLGYTIRYTLESYKSSTYGATFKGYPLFLDQLSSVKNQDKTLDYRERAYQGSQMHFFRSLYTKTLQEEGFKIYKVKKTSNINALLTNFGLMADTVFVPEPCYHMEQTTIPLNLYDNLFVMDKSAALQFEQPFEVRFTLNGEDKAYNNNSIYFNGMKRNLGQQTSIVMLQENSQVFYPNGSCKNAGNLVTIGYWSFKKVGEIMPWDYQPPKTAKQVVTLH
jgi:hypothetical protein